MFGTELDADVGLGLHVMGSIMIGAKKHSKVGSSM
jgi:hypothetical protein